MILAVSCQMAFALKHGSAGMQRGTWYEVEWPFTESRWCRLKSRAPTVGGQRGSSFHLKPNQRVSMQVRTLVRLVRPVLKPAHQINVRAGGACRQQSRLCVNFCSMYRRAIPQDFIPSAQRKLSQGCSPKVLPAGPEMEECNADC